MKIKLVIPFLAVGLISACGQKPDDTPAMGAARSSIDLPSDNGETVSVNGAMSFWMFEGDAGCYGTLESGSTEVQLWASADECVDVHYSENEQVNIEIKYSVENQYGPGKTFTVVKF